VRPIPPHVLRRNRQNSYAEEQAQGYKAQPPKTGGPCQLCGKVEDLHFAGQCEDWRVYVPPVEKCAFKGCQEMGAARDRYFVCPVHVREFEEAKRL
jgi:hypothetical protein